MDLSLLDWRRQVAELYRQVRNADDPAAAHELWCRERARLLMHHPQSPLSESVRSHYEGPTFYPYDPALRFTCALQGETAGQNLAVETGTDGVVHFGGIGHVGLGELGTLDVWWLEGYGGGIFVPMADPGKDNYGGGRYVLDTVKGADLGGTVDLESSAGSLIIDLNFAYNPSCAYDPRWACPLAPAGNRLRIAIEAGEKVPRT